MGKIRFLTNGSMEDFDLYLILNHIPYTNFWYRSPDLAFGIVTFMLYEGGVGFGRTLVRKVRLYTNSMKLDETPNQT